MTAYKLIKEQDKLALCLEPPSDFKPFFVNFKEYLKGQGGEGGRRLLYKAIKLKGVKAHQVLDVTGGWARDAFFLAAQGVQVTVVERLEPVYQLLMDARHRALHEPKLLDIMNRMDWINTDSLEFLKSGKTAPVIYLDPMFPPRERSAKVKKDLQILQLLCGSPKEGESEDLLRYARQANAQRVVVKRPIDAPFIDGQKPDFQYQGKTVRFDVYQRT